ncbi:prefoldin beta-like domain containing protein [Tieghemostelium lacteum]|uniref:Prefoldin beta-like domain containing protein n=1 Tax=Tieghemostelium lacteum TaxID=361077 RepID=A0A151ZE25_TIELA|nr:prefoldin beta-like domain containing protein [Tieghemostelium lacteum]|eukprot:KYQ92208.1 prefoldin beta-like domain containing protein [Tieghemostelium lacteum]
MATKIGPQPPPPQTPLVTEEQIVNAFKELKQQQSQIMTKISEFDNDVGEYNLVINAITGLEPTRKCFRMVGGVLVERTVGDVLPTIQQNKDGIEGIIKKLEEQLNSKTKEINDFAQKYKIKIQNTQ